MLRQYQNPGASASFFLLLVFCLPFLWVQDAIAFLESRRASIGRDNRRQERREAKRLEAEAPPALKPRKRSLTSPIPVTPFSALVKRKTASQDQCALLNMLPWEVRRMIWERVLGGEMFHIIRMPKKISHVRCTMSNEYRGETVYHRCWGFYAGSKDRTLPPVPGLYCGPRTCFDPSAGGLLPILRSCRKIYSESIDILYSQNLFDLNHILSLQYLSSTLLPKRFNQIRSLQLTWDVGRFNLFTYGDEIAWKKTWSTIAKMEGLRNLYVVLYEADDGGGGPLSEKLILGPLYAATQVEKFEVEMADIPPDWPSEKTPAPFLLKYPDRERSHETMLGSRRGIFFPG